MKRIGIVGAGLSGRLVALHLLGQAPSAAEVVTIDRGGPRHLGPAYSDDAGHLLLNVPAERMGALPGDPAHFLAWARGRGVPAGRFDFLPRRLYREYVLDLVAEARRARPDPPRLEHVQGEVIDLEVTPGGVAIRLEGGASVVVDRAVLALGNFPPRHPPVGDRAVLESPRYARDPWRPGLFDALDPGDTVVLVGTGQTAVDLAATLHRRGHPGRIVGISRRGLLPLVHRGFEPPYPPFFAEVEGATRILDLLRVVRRHLARAAATGFDARAVVDSLRPVTQTLWRGLPDEEKRRFLRHVFRHWEIVRSRIPAESEAILDALRAAGRLEIVAGRVLDLVEVEGAIEVRLAPRGAAGVRAERAALVVNCVGPESDVERIDHPLIAALLRRGLIRPGPARLGIDALPDGAVVGQDGAASELLFTLGSTMKGVLWEVVAAPEIRVQAERLARRLVEELRGPAGR
jgi:uncharacterized NAD(P)/FAD-binding protein YdhS